MNRINIITLGVKDIQKSLSFYSDGLGFLYSAKEGTSDILFLDCQGTKLVLYSLDELAKDIDSINPPSKGGFSGFTLAYNCKTKDEVDSIFSVVNNIGGTIVKNPGIAFWGGYSGYFMDLDGYYWEVAYADFWEFDKNDMLLL